MEIRIPPLSESVSTATLMTWKKKEGDPVNRDEVLVCWAFATRGRLNARLGGLKAADAKGLDGLV